MHAVWASGNAFAPIVRVFVPYLSSEVTVNNRCMTYTTPDTNAERAAAVMDELQSLSNIENEHIGVAVDGGTVTLTGRVGTYPETLLAAKAALSVEGVTAVAQELTVSRPPRSGGVDATTPHLA